MPDTPTPPAIDGVVLAAGRSRRMGEPKPLLDVDGERFVERAVRVLREGGCRVVVVVARDEDGETARLAGTAGASVVLNTADDSEQIDSLRLALRALPVDSAAALVLPVDQPRVRTGTVARVVDAFRARGAPIVRPVHEGTPGHPTLFAREVFGELLEGDLSDGAETVVRAHAGEVEDVAVEDEGATLDVNTPEEYRRRVERT